MRVRRQWLAAQRGLGDEQHSAVLRCASLSGQALNMGGGVV